MKSQHRIRNKRKTNWAAHPLIGVSLFRVLLKRHRIAWKAPVKPPNRRPVRQASSLIIRSFSDNRSCNTRGIYRLSGNTVTCPFKCLQLRDTKHVSYFLILNPPYWRVNYEIESKQPQWLLNQEVNRPVIVQYLEVKDSVVGLLLNKLEGTKKNAYTNSNPVCQ